MRKVLGYAAAVVLAALAGFGISRHIYHDDAAGYRRQRSFLLTGSAHNRPRGEVLIIGDSIVDLSSPDSLCGKQVFNGGISSARLSDIVLPAADLSRTLRPSRIYVEIGTNDADKREPTDVGEWKARYENMVRSFGRVPVTLVPSPTMQLEKHFAQHLSAAHLDDLDAQIPDIAKATGASVLPRPSVDTLDGVHPSPKGAEAWQQDLAKGCQGTRGEISAG